MSFVAITHIYTKIKKKSSLWKYPVKRQNAAEETIIQSKRLRRESSIQSEDTRISPPPQCGAASILTDPDVKGKLVQNKWNPKKEEAEKKKKKEEEEEVEYTLKVHFIKQFNEDGLVTRCKTFILMCDGVGPKRKGYPVIWFDQPFMLLTIDRGLLDADTNNEIGLNDVVLITNPAAAAAAAASADTANAAVADDDAEDPDSKSDQHQGGNRSHHTRYSRTQSEKEIKCYSDSSDNDDYDDYDISDDDDY